MKRKKQPFKVELSKRAKILGWMFSFGIVVGIFGICLALMLPSMKHGHMAVVGLSLIMTGMGLFSIVHVSHSYSYEYNKCVANSLYTTILWDEEHDAKYIVVQDGHGNVIEINNMPVTKEFQTSGRYMEKMAAEDKKSRKGG